MQKIRKFFHNLRYRDYANSPEFVIPADKTVSEHADTAIVQTAINTVSGIGTPNYAIYQQDLAIYNATWYRWFIRKPFWIVGGLVVLGRGEYTIKTPLHLRSNTTIRGEENGVTLKADGER